MGNVQVIVEEVSWSKVFRDGNYADLHHRIKVRHSNVIGRIAGGTMKIKTTGDEKELIDNIS
jgi:hypothetical protein